MYKSTCLLLLILSCIQLQEVVGRRSPETSSSRKEGPSGANLMPDTQANKVQPGVKNSGSSGKTSSSSRKVGPSGANLMPDTQAHKDQPGVKKSGSSGKTSSSRKGEPSSFVKAVALENKNKNRMNKQKADALDLSHLLHPKKNNRGAEEDAVDGSNDVVPYVKIPLHKKAVMPNERQLGFCYTTDGRMYETGDIYTDNCILYLCLVDDGYPLGTNQSCCWGEDMNLHPDGSTYDVYCQTFLCDNGTQITTNTNVTECCVDMNGQWYENGELYSVNCKEWQCVDGVAVETYNPTAECCSGQVQTLAATTTRRIGNDGLITPKYISCEMGSLTPLLCLLSRDVLVPLSDIEN
ncbi:hypothetical protein C7M84_011404 [Penaeus vannamei]|uniref:Uncharacterized protein n=1 Tax=Penaeus vannamei TaxID=6689 RepID=A0A3R7MUV7_PENVA|nr:hypothetical protein C7M84_011404 [Penaeus vannamei]